MKNSRNKEFTSFKLCLVLSSMIKSGAVPPHLSRDVNHPFVQHIHVCIHHAPCALVTQQLSELSDQLLQYPIVRSTDPYFTQQCHICISFIAVYFKIVRSLVIVNLLLCLIHKLNFIIDMFMQEKTIHSFGTIHGFMHRPGVLEHMLCG